MLAGGPGSRQAGRLQFQPIFPVQAFNGRKFC